MRSQLSKNDRKKFNTVLIVDVHNRDIIDRFVRDRLDSELNHTHTQIHKRTFQCSTHIRHIMGLLKKFLAFPMYSEWFHFIIIIVVYYKLH